MSSPSPSEPSLADRLAGELLALCRIPSVTGQEQALCDHVQAQLAPTAFHGVRMGNSLAVRGPDRGRPRITLAGHLDTVPPPTGTGPVRREGSRLHGPGSSDMKAGLVVMLHLARTLDLEALPWDLGLVFYDREEGPYEDNGLEPLLREVPWIAGTALAVCLEPSRNEVQPGCLGSLHAWVRYRGRSAHSARPWQGKNAVHRGGRLLQALQEAPPPARQVEGLRFRQSLHVTRIRATGARNVIPDRLELGLNYRFAPGTTVEEAEAHVRSVAWDADEIEVTDRAPAAGVHLEDPVVRRFVASMGGRVAPKLAWTDVARFEERGVPAVNCGPGLADQAHQADEYAELEPLVEAARRFRRFLVDS